MADDLKLALDKLSATTKAARLRALMPLIEAKRAQGVRHAEIVAALNERGFELTEETYRNYLHRQRKRQRKSPPTISQPLGVVASATPPPISAPKAVAATRPPTFDYDPRGTDIADLLK